MRVVCRKEEIGAFINGAESIVELQSSPSLGTVKDLMPLIAFRSDNMVLPLASAYARKVDGQLSCLDIIRINTAVNFHIITSQSAKPRSKS